jgi:hypothetical protein
MYYSTQLDADGNEYSIENGQKIIIQDASGVNRNSRSYDPYPNLKDDDYVPTVMDPESFCPRRLKKSEAIAEIEKRKNIATFKRISIPLVKKEETKLEIGAGAKIWQEIGVDPESLDFWQEEPAGLIYVNYVTVEKAAEILEAGKRQDKKEGFMNACLVGH